MSARVQLIARHLHARLLALLVRVEAEVEARAALNSTIAEALDGRLELGAAQGRALLLGLRERSGEGLAGARGLHATRNDPVELALRSEAEAAGVELPLLALAEALALRDDEQAASLLALAPELDGRWGQLFGWLADDLGRRRPTAELCARILHADEGARVDLLRRLGPWGTLRRCGVLRVDSDGGLELAPEARELLLGGPSVLLRRLRDPELLELDRRVPRGLDLREAEDLADALAGAGPAPVIVIHSAAPSVRADAAACLARRAGLALRRIRPGPGDFAAQLRAGLTRAMATGTLAWIELDDLDHVGLREESLEHDAPPRFDAAIVAELESFVGPVLISASLPWRPLALAGSRPLLECELPGLDDLQRASLWRELLPELDDERAADLAARLPLDEAELRAAALQTQARRRARGNGHASHLDAALSAALRTVTLRTTHRFATVIEPRRRPEDLILPAALHERVLEVASFAEVRAEVDRGWGLGRMVTGAGGVRALFSGESGTGKTLAAEVVAGQLGMTMLRIDLARVISKWVGETEKQLERAFAEALDAHAVLVFDEGDALFGKRAEVRQGQDRWANLEVSYLLQRIEDHAGPVILASNLRENIDPAFTRRFQVVVHFPRPRLPERRRIWSLALPDDVPLSGEVDLDRFAEIDMTGAGIVDAARTGAMLARVRGAEVVRSRDLIDGIARVFEREGRLFSPEALTPGGKPRARRGAR